MKPAPTRRPFPCANPARGRGFFLAAAIAALAIGCGGGGGGTTVGDTAVPPIDPPEVQAGERLFLETRFARFFRDHSFDHWNEAELAGGGDPVMRETVTTGAPLVGPFFGESMNCRACHLVDEQARRPGGGFRTYADFATRSPIPAAEDGQGMAPRNSPALVNATLAREHGLLLHFDGEFASTEDLVVGTMTGRNFGWMPGQRQDAIAHIANVLRHDDGSGELAEEFGGLSYRGLLSSTGIGISSHLRLPEEYRIDVDTASDDELVAAVSRLVTAYVEGLLFSQNDDGDFSASAYDVFLMKNGLPRKPSFGQSDLQYSRSLRAALDNMASPLFVDGGDGRTTHHDHGFVFGPEELEGLRLFLAEDGGEDGVGNCIGCHPAPAFTDFAFHNTGISQRSYDAVHGDGAFASLEIPGLAERNAAPDAWLPPSEEHPAASGRYRSFPAAGADGHADLGAWNVLGNAAMPHPQDKLLETLCAEPDLADVECSASSLLPRVIAYFKTPGLRDLGESGPYQHDGTLGALEEVVDHYVRFAALAREGKVRNASAQLEDVRLSTAQAASVVAFLRSLDEDYE